MKIIKIKFYVTLIALICVLGCKGSTVANKRVDWKRNVAASMNDEISIEYSSNKKMKSGSSHKVRTVSEEDKARFNLIGPELIISVFNKKKITVTMDKKYYTDDFDIRSVFEIIKDGACIKKIQIEIKKGRSNFRKSIRDVRKLCTQTEEKGFLEDAIKLITQWKKNAAPFIVLSPRIQPLDAACGVAFITDNKEYEVLVLSNDINMSLIKLSKRIDKILCKEQRSKEALGKEGKFNN